MCAIGSLPPFRLTKPPVDAVRWDCKSTADVCILTATNTGHRLIPGGLPFAGGVYSPPAKGRLCPQEYKP